MKHDMLSEMDRKDFEKMLEKLRETVQKPDGQKRLSNAIYQMVCGYGRRTSDDGEVK